MPSRLKGIETVGGAGVGMIYKARLNVPSRLKGIETPRSTLMISPRFSSLNVPSRLKGIETLDTEFQRLQMREQSECAFPFEGN